MAKGRWDSIELTADEVEAFQEQGFVVLQDVWSPAEVAEMREAFVRLYEVAQELRTTRLYKGSSFVLNPRDGHTAVARIVWCGAAEPVLLRYGADPRLLKMAARLLGSREMDQLINQAHFKMPGDGVGFPWHQDIQHRDKKLGDWQDVNGKGSFVQMLTALHDFTADNGPVLFVPKSHKLGRLSFVGSDYSDPAGESEGGSFETQFDVSTAVPALGPAGSVVLFGPYAVHGSYPNSSPKPRFTFINGYAYPGANHRVYPGEGSGRRLIAP